MDCASLHTQSLAGFLVCELASGSNHPLTITHLTSDSFLLPLLGDILDSGQCCLDVSLSGTSCLVGIMSLGDKLLVNTP